MRWCRAEDAVAAIPPGARVVLPHGCVEPASIYRALAASRGHPSRPPVLYTGLQFGSYAFLGSARGPDDPGRGALGAGYRLVTWQVGRAIRGLVETGQVGFLPLRFRDIPRVFGPGGALRADVAVVQCAPPRGGTVSLGISCSIFPSVIEAARLVIAEMHPEMPWTVGETEIPVERIDLAVEAEAPLGTLERARADDVDRAIVDRVLGLLPARATVQLGVGSVPDAVLDALAGRADARLYSGMLSDALLSHLEHLERRGTAGFAAAGEVCGTAELYRRLDGERRVELLPTTRVHDVPTIARIPRFVSINSAVEVDLGGQVNGEAVGGRQVSGVGGCLDFVEGARCSAGGLSVIALRSTARGRSRIVARLEAGCPVTVPRFAVDAVVTEHGVARLAGRTLEERAEALIAIAAPEARGALGRAAEREFRRASVLSGGVGAA